MINLFVFEKKKKEMFLSDFSRYILIFQFLSILHFTLNDSQLILDSILKITFCRNTYDLSLSILLIGLNYIIKWYLIWSHLCKYFYHVIK